MRSRVRLKLAETIRAGLDEFAERWIRFVRANELAPDTDEPVEEAVNRARLGFEVLANLLEDASYSKFENVIRRLLHDWINRAATFSDLMNIREAFPRFIVSCLPIEPDSEEEAEFLDALDEFFDSDLRPRFLAHYLEVYEEIIGAESHHTAYILAHFDAILSLSAHLNAAETREEILAGLILNARDLFESIHGIVLLSETPEGLIPKALVILDEEMPPAMLSRPIPERIREVFDVGEVRWLAEADLPTDFRSLIDVETSRGLAGCAIPIRPREADGLLLLLAVGGETPGALELSLSRVAASECALALDRVNSRARVTNVNRRIRDILALSRDTGWGAGQHETAEIVVDYLLGLTGGTRAIFLTPTSLGASPTVPLAWRNVPDDALRHFQRATRLPSVVTIALKSGKIHLLTAEKLARVLAGKEPPPGFGPADNEALGILPLERKGARQGVCLFLCPRSFALEPESADILAIFARTAVDSLATAREFERSVKTSRLVEEDATRARIVQRQLTPRYIRSGGLVYWAHLQPAGELAGDVLVARQPSPGRLNIWIADVAGRGVSAGWSMMFIRQLLAELPVDIQHPAAALTGINARLHDIELKTTPGIFATMVGLHIDEASRVARFVRAGAPRLFKVCRDGSVEILDPDGLPLGLFANAQLEEMEIPIAPGDKLVWASDGLLGVRNDAGARWRQDGLAGCVADGWHLPARALYERILTAVGEFAGDGGASDDWSLVVVGDDPEPDWIGSRPGRDRDRLLDQSLAWLREKGIGDGDFTALRTLLNEAIKNAHEHGNQLNDNALIEVKLSHSSLSVHVMVRDEGGRLNERVTNPLLRPQSILEDKGRGFLLMRHQCDHLWVEEDRGELNAVRLLEAHA